MAAPSMNAIAGRYADQGVSSIFLYTHEAHPEEHYPHLTSMAQKLRHAHDLWDVLGVTRPILVDSLDGACHRAYGSMPNVTWIFNKAGVVHGMLTEFVRKPPYDLAFDGEVNPNATHFHLMIPPFDPFGNPSPVPTGFELPNGMEQPFFHVMFPLTEVSARPLGAMSEGEGAAAATTAAAQPTATTAAVSTGEVREIEVTARMPKFSPNEFTIKKGKTVRFVVTAEDVFHTFTVRKNKDDKQFIHSLNLFPNQEPGVWEWTPAEAGDYYLYCIPHEGLGMTGTIHVVEE